MNSLKAPELKRRGMAAVEEALRKGPVHLIKRNKAFAVAVSVQDYARLSGRKMVTESGMTAAQWLLKLPARGRSSKQQMDAVLRSEGDDWA